MGNMYLRDNLSRSSLYLEVHGALANKYVTYFDGDETMQALQRYQALACCISLAIKENFEPGYARS